MPEEFVINAKVVAEVVEPKPASLWQLTLVYGTPTQPASATAQFRARRSDGEWDDSVVFKPYRIEDTRGADGALVEPNLRQASAVNNLILDCQVPVNDPRRAALGIGPTQPITVREIGELLVLSQGG